MMERDEDNKHVWFECSCLLLATCIPVLNIRSCNLSDWLRTLMCPSTQISDKFMTMDHIGDGLLW